MTSRILHFLSAAHLQCVDIHPNRLADETLRVAARGSSIAVIGLAVLTAIGGAIVGGVLIALCGTLALYFNAHLLSRVREMTTHRSEQAAQELDAFWEKLGPRPTAFQSTLGPRSLGPEARHLTLSALACDVPAQPVNIFFVGGSDPEPFRLAQTLTELLRDASWPIGLIGGGSEQEAPATGLAVLVSDKGDTPIRAERLHTALTAGALAPRLVRSPNCAPDTVTLSVGLNA